MKGGLPAFRGVRRYRAGAHWLNCVSSVLRGLGRVTLLLWAVNLVGTEVGAVTINLWGSVFNHLAEMKIELLGTLSEFDDVLALLEDIYFELPILLLLVLVIDNLVVILRTLTAPWSGIQTLHGLALLSFRFVDMGRDVVQLHSDYGMFRLRPIS